MARKLTAARDVARVAGDRAWNRVRDLGGAATRLRERARPAWYALRERAGWRPLAQRDSSETLFRGIQRNLLLWYMGVLTAILLLAGFSLYTGMRSQLMDPVTVTLTQSARDLAHIWQETGVPPCADPRVAIHSVPYAVCYDQTLSNAAVKMSIAANGPASYIAPFVEPSLALTALRQGSASDTVTGANGVGAIQRYALVARDSGGNVLGVVQVGFAIQGEVQALQTLLHLLLLGGLVTLVGALLGGIVLSYRALSPARLALKRQQSFIADASHEIRTPLALLHTNAEVLLHSRERMDPDDVELIEDIRVESRHMANLLRNMLTLARLDAEETPQHHDLVDLNDIAASVTHRAHHMAAERGLTLECVASEPALMLGDQALVEQAAMILVDNAMKYTRAGGHIGVSVSRTWNTVAFAVRDTGIGIAPEHLPKLGQRFYRADKARSREMGGVGLGLSIGRRIARLHRGALRLASAPGEGTTATLTFPAVRHP